MEKEDQIIGMLEKVIAKQDEHSQILNEHGRILNEHSQILNEHGRILNEHSQILNEHSQILNEHGRILNEHSQILNEQDRILNEHSQILNEHGRILNEHSQKLDNHASQLEEHGQILSALRSGQEYLKAEIDGMKITNAKEFGDIKEQLNVISVNQELLRDETWNNKVEIQRIKNTMGMK